MTGAFKTLDIFIDQAVDSIFAETKARAKAQLTKEIQEHLDGKLKLTELSYLARAVLGQWEQYNKERQGEQSEKGDSSVYHI